VDYPVEWATSKAVPSHRHSHSSINAAVNSQDEPGTSGMDQEIQSRREGNVTATDTSRFHALVEAAYQTGRQLKRERRRKRKYYEMD
jgi:hypothetical protein